MKKLLFVLMALCGTMIPCMAEGNPIAPSDSLSRKHKNLIPPVKGGNLRPTAPSRVYIVCEYAPGVMTLTLPTGIYQVTARLYNETVDWTGLFTRDIPTVEIPLITGSCNINCVSDDGRVFSTTLDF